VARSDGGRARREVIGTRGWRMARGAARRVTSPPLLRLAPLDDVPRPGADQLVGLQHHCRMPPVVAGPMTLASRRPRPAHGLNACGIRLGPARACVLPGLLGPRPRLRSTIHSRREHGRFLPSRGPRGDSRRDAGGGCRRHTRKARTRAVSVTIANRLPGVQPARAGAALAGAAFLSDAVRVGPDLRVLGYRRSSRAGAGATLRL
jgi:hypothetical protein